MVALLCLFRGVGGFRVKGGCFVVVVFELVFAAMQGNTMRVMTAESG